MTHTWPAGIAYGGDYNPEQWPREVWDEDMALMREAGVNLVSVGIWSWAKLEPSPGVFEFGWLDELLDLLHANGIAVDLATPTASPPAWFFAAHPEARIVDRTGTVQGFGSRGIASHASQPFREAIRRIAGAVAERYASHPAVVMWHIHNEYGVPNAEDYSPAAVAAFREWCRARYGTLDALNEAWGTAVWGQTYYEWDQIQAPAYSGQAVNPTQRLKYRRFTDEALRECFRIEKDAIRAHSDLPVTTNLMTNSSWETDLWTWAEEMDVISDDHYLDTADPAPHIGLALAADTNRSLGRGKPWILMEHSTSAVNWQDRNVAKRPGELARNSLTHVARGADAVLFFQWRAARYGPEKYHSTMLPHSGTRGRVWGEVVELGGTLGSLAEVAGSRVRADVAILVDYESVWAQRLEWRPSIDHTAQERIRAYYEACWRAGLTVDIAHPSQDLSGYSLVIAPAQYLLRVEDAENLNAYVEGGGTLVVSYFSAIVYEYDAVHRGGFVAPLEPSLGLMVDEFLPFLPGQSAEVEWDGETFPVDVWQEVLLPSGAETVAVNVSGPGAGQPAVTRHSHGAGTGWYVAARLGAAGLAKVIAAACADAGLDLPLPDAPLDGPGVEVVTRHGHGVTYTFAINHTDQPARLALAGTDLVSGEERSGEWELPAGKVAVIRG